MHLLAGVHQLLRQLLFAVCGHHKRQVPTADAHKRQVTSANVHKCQVPTADAHKYQVHTADAHKRQVTSADAHKSQVTSADAHKHQVPTADAHKGPGVHPLLFAGCWHQKARCPQLLHTNAHHFGETLARLC
eukprot:1159677-Pelagomonas_calceolata.AAC.8